MGSQVHLFMEINICVANHMTPGKVYDWSKLTNFSQNKCRNLSFMKNHQFNQENPRKFENDKNSNFQSSKPKLLKWDTITNVPDLG